MFLRADPRFGASPNLNGVSVALDETTREGLREADPANQKRVLPVESQRERFEQQRPITALYECTTTSPGSVRSSWPSKDIPETCEQPKEGFEHTPES